MRTFGIIGFPLSHSFSQRYFTQKFEQEGVVDAVFKNYAIKDIDELENVLATEPDLQGLAVTIPYKKAVLPFLNTTTEAVQQTGACNCIRIKDKALIGYNTDVIGFEESFKIHLQPHHTKALVLGSGGAAAAVEYVLQKMNIEYFIVSRRALPEKNIIDYKAVDEALLHQYNIIINCTPLGTYPEVNEAPALPYQLLTPQHYLFDLVYNPPLTKFLALGQAQGAIIQNGYDMLTIQAEHNWRIWNE
ncbi:shikimate dehydrogenase [Ilyomonas limi]|uniref:Shikimate dehydrogenase n=1 Tax=Ilyomonas limi TaxID=2575867 RepID=A0A4U3L7Z4_9BACT|nr:shikimate dehydrogenase [Ilyomonas limi]TKK69807.1 shikimate dehydrogenase [Ilyomonas limi]